LVVRTGANRSAMRSAVTVQVTNEQHRCSAAASDASSLSTPAPAGSASAVSVCRGWHSEWRYPSRSPTARPLRAIVQTQGVRRRQLAGLGGTEGAHTAIGLLVGHGSNSSLR
jgi:hypothetical protein